MQSFPRLPVTHRHSIRRCFHHQLDLAQFTFWHLFPGHLLLLPVPSLQTYPLFPTQPPAIHPPSDAAAEKVSSPIQARCQQGLCPHRPSWHRKTSCSSCPYLPSCLAFLARPSTSTISAPLTYFLTMTGSRGVSTLPGRSVHNFSILIQNKCPELWSTEKRNLV